jgi:hypothetical protein
MQWTCTKYGENKKYLQNVKKETLQKEVLTEYFHITNSKIPENFNIQI